MRRTNCPAKEGEWVGVQGESGAGAAESSVGEGECGARSALAHTMTRQTAGQVSGPDSCLLCSAGSRLLRTTKYVVVARGAARSSNRLPAHTLSADVV
jgi:hypothetical protein